MKLKCQSPPYKDLKFSRRPQSAVQDQNPNSARDPKFPKPQCAGEFFFPLGNSNICVTDSIGSVLAGALAARRCCAGTANRRGCGSPWRCWWPGLFGSSPPPSASSASRCARLACITSACFRTDFGVLFALDGWRVGGKVDAIWHGCAFPVHAAQQLIFDLKHAAR